MAIFEEIAQEIENEISKAEKSYYACQQCLHVHSDTSGICPKCNQKVYQWPGETADQALDRARRAKGIATTMKAGKTPVKQKVEPGIPEKSDDLEERNYRAEREARVANFIKKYNINTLSPVEVGSAIVQTVGFTIWQDKKPIFRLMQPFEDGRDFQAAYNEARALQPALRVDCCQCNRLSNEDLQKCVFRGDLIASTNNGQGTMWVKRGMKVKLGAYKTSSNNLRFVVLEVIC